MYVDFTGRMAPRYGMAEIVPIPEERARPSIPQLGKPGPESRPLMGIRISESPQEGARGC
ncbi:MAG: hypothetical protein DMG24_12815 [Acidobacteria bacterium]|nr:MAG: hypothetical protein DMG24_12815 [Acidobacteriota bacterium]